ncbi:maestro heat-like repeat-containing protein family member 1 isoform X2 [Mauremys mutica]|uniref:maestro heat-like repeat-containing protein family member 1 isoform X2 n=1 Tax=Mauremys mutica TaxID=74926 RepID=UPI001D1657F2|nr:maestro heat-like repeat-containing protein family member 1 isoform X2 [Mauremys mutica]
MPWPYNRRRQQRKEGAPTSWENQAKAIWRFLGADPTLTREVLHILLCDSPEKGQANARQSQDRSCPQPARLLPAGHGDPPKATGSLKSIPWLLLPSLQASQEGERMACTVLLAEFLGSPLLMGNEPKAMWKQVVKSMLQRTEDSNIHIRGRALHGLRNAVTEFPDKVRKKRDQILGSFVRAVCESCDPHAVLDAMEGLCWMLWDPKASLKAHVAIPLALQARTFFEDENSGLRRASMELFGHLSKFVCKKSSLFRAEVEESMGTLLIHLQDGDPQVAQACRVALLRCAPFLSFQLLRALVQSQLVEGAAPVIPAFLSEACSTLLQDCPKRLSKKAALRAAAAQQLIGYMMDN